MYLCNIYFTLNVDEVSSGFYSPRPSTYNLNFFIISKFSFLPYMYKFTFWSKKRRSLIFLKTFISEYFPSSPVSNKLNVFKQHWGSWFLPCVPETDRLEFRLGRWVCWLKICMFFFFRCLQKIIGIVTQRKPKPLPLTFLTIRRSLNILLFVNKILSRKVPGGVVKNCK